MRKRRSEARHVAWLFALTQDKTAHHTAQPSQRACLCCADLRSLVEKMESRMADMQWQITNLAAEVVGVVGGAAAVDTVKEQIFGPTAVQTEDLPNFMISFHSFFLAAILILLIIFLFEMVEMLPAE